MSNESRLLSRSDSPHPREVMPQNPELAECIEPRPPSETTPLVLEIREPRRRHDQRRSAAARRIGEPYAVSSLTETDVLLHSANSGPRVPVMVAQLGRKAGIRIRAPCQPRCRLLAHHVISRQHNNSSAFEAERTSSDGELGTLAQRMTPSRRDNGSRPRQSGHEVIGTVAPKPSITLVELHARQCCSVQKRRRCHFSHLSEGVAKRRATGEAHISTHLGDSTVPPIASRSIARTIRARCRHTLKVSPVSLGNRRLIVRTDVAAPEARSPRSSRFRGSDKANSATRLPIALAGNGRKVGRVRCFR